MYYQVACVTVTERDDFLLAAGGGRVHFYPFRREDEAARPARSLTKVSTRKSAHQPQPHSAHITCVDVSRDGQMCATGALDRLVNVWQLNSHELVLSLEGHQAAVTCVSFAPNGLFVASGAEDRTARVWGLTLGALVSTFGAHQAPLSAVTVLMDSARVLSADRAGALHLWLADDGTPVRSFSGPGAPSIAATNTMRYCVAGGGGANALRIWSLLPKDDERFTVSHSDEITCFVLTADSLQVSLKMLPATFTVLAAKASTRRRKSIFLLVKFLFVCESHSSCW